MPKVPKPSVPYVEPNKKRPKGSMPSNRAIQQAALDKYIAEGKMKVIAPFNINNVSKEKLLEVFKDKE